MGRVATGQAMPVHDRPLGTPRLQHLRHGEGHTRACGQLQPETVGIATPVEGVIQAHEVDTARRQPEIEPLPATHPGQFGPRGIGQRQVSHQFRIQFTGFDPDSQSLACFTLEPKPQHLLSTHTPIDHCL